MKSKNDLRSIIKKQRADMEENVRKVLDEKIYNNLIRNEAVRESRLFLVYASSPTETDTTRFINTLLSKGRQVAIPRCSGKDMRFFFIESLSQLRTSTFGVPEPDDSRTESVSDTDGSVCIVPGLSFDRFGKRLGYGGGYYDRFLKDHPCYSIGICYDSFFTDRLPAEEHDIGVSEIITEKGTVFKKNKTGRQ